MSIQLHIERLVLDEALLGGERADAVRQAIEQELAWRLAQPGAIPALCGIGTTQALASSVLPPSEGSRDRLGPRIAAAVGRGLGLQGTTLA